MMSCAAAYDSVPTISGFFSSKTQTASQTGRHCVGVKSRASTMSCIRNVLRPPYAASSSGRTVSKIAIARALISCNSSAFRCTAWSCRCRPMRCRSSGSGTSPSESSSGHSRGTRLNARARRQQAWPCAVVSIDGGWSRHSAHAARVVVLRAQSLPGSPMSDGGPRSSLSCILRSCRAASAASRSSAASIPVALRTRPLSSSPARPRAGPRG